MTSPDSEHLDLNAETRIIPDHELLKVVGRGSYGEVWLARNIMGTYRAVKIVRRTNFDHERPYLREFEGIQRFEPISRSHPSQINILHVGRTDEYFYYVMELADDASTGASAQLDPSRYCPRTLRQDLHERGKLPVSECLDLGVALTTALMHLAKHGLAHRDIKPSNIIFVNALPKLADPGLINTIDASQSYVGTLGFAPPEGPGTVQADIYSLGKVLYEAATGRDRQDFPELPTATVADLVEEAELRELNEILVRACDPVPARRYQRAEDLYNDLLLVKSGKSVARLRKTERRLRLAGRATVAAALMLVIAGAAFWVRTRQLREVKRLVAENQRRVRELQDTEGFRLLELQDNSGALVSFATAAKTAARDAAADLRERARIGSILQHSPRLLCVRAIHNGGLLTGGFSPDGALLLPDAGTACEKIDLSGNRIWRFSFTQTNLQATGEADVENTGRFIATFHDDGRALQLWDSAMGARAGSPLKCSAEITSWSISGDGRVVAGACADTNVCVFDLARGSTLTTTIAAKLRPTTIDLSFDGRTLLTSSGDQRPLSVSFGEAQLWSTESGKPIGEPVRLQGETRAIFGPDGRRFYTFNTHRASDVRSPSEIRVWDATTGQPLSPPFRTENSIRDLAISPDGRKMIGGTADSTAILWNAVTGERMGPEFRHSDVVTQVRFSGDSLRAALAAIDGTVKIVNVNTGQQCATLRHEDQVFVIQFSPDARLLLTITLRGTVRVWDLSPSDGPPPLIRNSGSLTRAGVLGSGGFFALETSDLVHICDDSGKLIRTIDHRPEWLPADPNFDPSRKQHLMMGLAMNAAFTKSGSAVATTIGPSIRIWDTSTGARLNVITNASWFLSCAFSPDGRTVLARDMAGDEYLYDSAAGTKLQQLSHAGSDFGQPIFSEDGKWVVSPGRQPAISVWETATGKSVWAADGMAIPSSVVLDHRGRKLLVLTGSDVAVFSTETWKSVVTLHEPTTITSATFTPDDKSIVTATPNQVQVWDAETGKRLGAPLREKSFIRSLALNPEGTKVVTGSKDGAVRVWDLRSGEPLSQILQTGESVWSVDFTQDGQKLLIANSSTVCLYPLPSCDWGAEDIGELAGLMSGGENPQESSDETARKLLPLKERHATYFTQDSREILAWHRARFEEAEVAHQFASVEFHLRELEKSKPDEHEIAGLRNRLDRERIPARAAELPRNFVDLSDYMDSSLDLNWHANYTGFNLSALPRGLQQLAGVTFDIRGMVQLGRPEQLYAGRRLAARIPGITLNQKAARVHFLHGSMGSSAFPDGTVIGSYVFHYRSGASDELPIRYGIDLRDWFHSPDHPLEAAAAEVAWTGPAPGLARIRNNPPDVFCVVYKRTWTNPRPDDELKTIDFNSVAGNNPLPFLIAITTE